MIPNRVRWQLIVVSVVLSGCTGTGADGPRADASTQYDAFQLRDVVFPDTDPMPKIDSFTPDTFNPCTVFDSEGQSCNGGQACPSGQQAYLEPTGGCTCRIACNPTQPDQCAAGACNRYCQQLFDTGGQALPGIGACLAHAGAQQGEPCAPAVCHTGMPLTCVGNSAEESFCRESCSGPSDCRGLKMVCIQLSGPTNKVCIPGGSTTGPTEGQSCAGANDYCQQGLICDPADTTCRKACNTDQGNDPCTGGKTCQQLFDSAANILLGFGCK